MNLKKLALVVILFSGIIGCDCFNGGTEWNINDFSVLALDKNDNLPVNGIIEGDSIRLQITFEAEFLAVNSNPFTGFMSSALATSCPDPGDDGLNDKIKSFSVSSNAPFNAVPAGASLNELIIANRRESIADWLADSDSWSFQFHWFSELTFIEKPEAASKHIFTLKFVLESGKIIEQTTDEIQWN